MTQVDQILSEFIDAWNAGRRPDAATYLERVPHAEREELARQLETWLAVAPTPRYDPAAIEAVRADPAVAEVLAGLENDAAAWPAVLPSLRARAGLGLRELAARVTGALGLRGQEERTAGYLERLERGELDAGRVSRRLLDTLAGALGVDRDALHDAAALGRGVRAASAGALFRGGDASGEWLADDLDALSRAASAPAPAPMDEVDRLFCGGPDG